MGTKTMTLAQAIDEITKERADWLVDAIATSTQDRRYLRGDSEEDRVATESILLNAEKAIGVAITRALIAAQLAKL